MKLGDRRTDNQVKTLMESVENVVSAIISVPRSTWHVAERSRTTARYRWICTYIARGVFCLSYPEIGRYYGQDHSTLVQGVNCGLFKIMADKDKRETITRCYNECKEKLSTLTIGMI